MQRNKTNTPQKDVKRAEKRYTHRKKKQNALQKDKHTAKDVKRTAKGTFYPENRVTSAI